MKFTDMIPDKVTNVFHTLQKLMWSCDYTNDKMLLASFSKHDVEIAFLLPILSFCPRRGIVAQIVFSMNYLTGKLKWASRMQSQFT